MLIVYRNQAVDCVDNQSDTPPFTCYPLEAVTSLLLSRANLLSKENVIDLIKSYQTLCE